MIGNTRIRSTVAALAGALLLLIPAGAALAQEKGDDAPAVVKDFEAGKKAGEKAAAGAKTKAPKKTKAQKKTVKLSFTVSPRVKARVYYGRKLLGTTPFSVDWPRNSGPVDVVVRAGGFLPVNTRAYTFRDDDVSVKLTRPADAHTLLGYKKPVEAPPEEDEEDDEGDETPSSAPTGPATPSPAAPSPAAPTSP